jgi:hypothetical protein
MSGNPAPFHSDLERQIADILQKAGFAFDAEPRVGGLRPDFVATGSNGATVVIEAKTWAADAHHLERARRQADGYRIATGAEAALVVLPVAPSAGTPSGVLGVSQLASWLQYFGHDTGKAPPDKTPTVPAASSTPFTVFAAMPFSSAYDDVYLVAMSYAAEQIGATCVRVDHEDFTGDIVTEIRRLIAGSAAVIADLSEAKPNVLYEVGYAHALGRPTVHICSTPMSALPFDVAHDNTMSYTPGQTFALRDKLAKRLRVAIDAPAT